MTTESQTGIPSQKSKVSDIHSDGTPFVRFIASPHIKMHISFARPKKDSPSSSRRKPRQPPTRESRRDLKWDSQSTGTPSQKSKVSDIHLDGTPFVRFIASPHIKMRISFARPKKDSPSSSRRKPRQSPTRESRRQKAVKWDSQSYCGTKSISDSQES
jgi:hypothetical protein